MNKLFFHRGPTETECITLCKDAFNFIGRSAITKLKDSRCSRKQVQVVVNNSCSVTVKVLGSNPSSKNGVNHIKGDSFTVNVGESFCLLEDQCQLFLASRTRHKRPISESSATDNVTEIESKCLKLSGEESTIPTSSVEVRREDQISWATRNLQILQQNASKATNKEESVPGSCDNPSISNAVPLSPGWTVDSDIGIFNSTDVVSSSRIASFDIDWTIIKTASGNVFPKDINDWQIIFPEVPGRLKQMHAKGYKIVFFSNQRGVSVGKVTTEQLKQKMETLQRKLGVPIQMFLCFSGLKYRKPCDGMWTLMTQQWNSGITPNMDESFYVGDAAGRPAKWAAGKKKDYACSDRLFALNIGIRFHTPEEFFQNKPPAPYHLPDFKPTDFRTTDMSLVSPPSATFDSSVCEVIVMVGFPAAGKSHFVENCLKPKGYTVVSRDVVKTWQKVVADCEAAVASDKAVAVDNTNLDSESRARYVRLAVRRGVACRCAVMRATLDHARHNEKFREMLGEKHEKINEMVFNQMKSKYTEPQLEEGFSEIIHINFKPVFKKESHSSLYFQYLLEK